MLKEYNLPAQSRFYKVPAAFKIALLNNNFKRSAFGNF